MIPFIQYEEATGRILTSGNTADITGLASAGIGVVTGDRVTDPDSAYVLNGVAVTKPIKPSKFHDWDWTTKSWIPNADKAREAKKVELNQEFLTRAYADIFAEGYSFDADELARTRISAVLNRLNRGDGLPTNWAGWRVTDNSMVWALSDAAAVATSLAGVARAIEDREQELMISVWQHKANLDLITDVVLVESYDLSVGW